MWALKLRGDLPRPPVLLPDTQECACRFTVASVVVVRDGKRAVFIRHVSRLGHVDPLHCRLEHVVPTVWRDQIRFVSFFRQGLGRRSGPNHRVFGATHSDRRPLPDRIQRFVAEFGRPRKAFGHGQGQPGRQERQLDRLPTKLGAWPSLLSEERCWICDEGRILSPRRNEPGDGSVNRTGFERRYRTTDGITTR